MQKKRKENKQMPPKKNALNLYIIQKPVRFARIFELSNMIHKDFRLTSKPLSLNLAIIVFR